METKNNRLLCDICGKLMSYSKPFYSWTYFGSSTDSEPPEPNHAHKECYEKQTEKEKNLTESVCWIKPWLHNSETIIK